MEPTFSIITVSYNAEETLDITIRSVLSQTYSQLEYIIVDGASTDGTSAIIDNYRRDISRVICEPDKGIYDAMNKGLRAATGDYVCFLNAGDTFYQTTTIEKVARSLMMQHISPDVIYGDTMIVDKERCFKRMRRLSPPKKLNWKSFKRGMLVCHQAFFAKRILAEPYDLTYRFSSDFDWCIRVMKKSSSFYNTRAVLVKYLDEGVTTQNRMESLKERFRIMVKHYGWISTILYHFWFVLRAVFMP